MFHLISCCYFSVKCFPGFTFRRKWKRVLRPAVGLVEWARLKSIRLIRNNLTRHMRRAAYLYMIGEESKRHLEVFTIHPFKLSFFHSLDWNVRKKSKQSTTSDCVFCQQESCIHKRNWRDYLWRGQVWYFISYVEVSSCLSHCSLSFSTYAMFEMEIA